MTKPGPPLCHLRRPAQLRASCWAEKTVAGHHGQLRSELANRITRPGPEAVARHVAAADPAARRRASITGCGTLWGYEVAHCGQTRYLTVILIVVFALDGAASPLSGVDRGPGDCDDGPLVTWGGQAWSGSLSQAIASS
jgi:hypothetical protein